MDLNVTLDFFCCCCEQPVRVTVQCKGDGLSPAEPAAVTAVNVPCPGCGQVNRLLFEPTGRVRSVRPYSCFRPLPEPSLN
jgi:hypothetical protein